MFSKRWTLIHILGGKCVECNNENLYDLEIDHINNDGDIERLYHTNMVTEYIKNPQKANERLQILCKKCHELKHHTRQIIIPKTPREIGIFPSKNGRIISMGTAIGNVDELMICELDDGFKPKKLLRLVDLSEPDFEIKPVARIQLFMDSLRKLEGENQICVEKSKLIDELTAHGFKFEEADMYIKRMLREASIYESKPGCYNLV